MMSFIDHAMYEQTHNKLLNNLIITWWNNILEWQLAISAVENVVHWREHRLSFTEMMKQTNIENIA